MADKILDDDDIIDLTDLLEEGEPKEKEKEKIGASPVPANEPDSFDLGKEISMEYDVSVEEIEQGSEGIDIDASLSSNEEVALTQEKEGEEVPVPGETGGASYDSTRQKGSADTALAAPTADADDSVATILEETPEQGHEELTPEPVLTGEGPENLDVEKPLAQETKHTFSPGQDGIGMQGKLEQEPIQTLTHPRITEDVLCELRQQIPAMLEGFVKPLMAELVKEMIAATREQLPGIVEKVIREEIDKLKRLDS